MNWKKPGRENYCAQEVKLSRGINKLIRYKKDLTISKDEKGFDIFIPKELLDSKDEYKNIDPFDIENNHVQHDGFIFKDHEVRIPSRQYFFFPDKN
jgi:hypothetical protein